MKTTPIMLVAVSIAFQHLEIRHGYEKAPRPKYFRPCELPAIHLNSSHVSRIKDVKQNASINKRQQLYSTSSCRNCFVLEKRPADSKGRLSMYVKHWCMFVHLHVSNRTICTSFDSHQSPFS